MQNVGRRSDKALQSGARREVPGPDCVRLVGVGEEVVALNSMRTVKGWLTHLRGPCQIGLVLGCCVHGGSGVEGIDTAVHVNVVDEPVH